MPRSASCIITNSTFTRQRPFVEKCIHDMSIDATYAVDSGARTTKRTWLERVYRTVNRKKKTISNYSYYGITVFVKLRCTETELRDGANVRAPRVCFFNVWARSRDVDSTTRVGNVNPDEKKISSMTHSANTSRIKMRASRANSLPHQRTDTFPARLIHASFRIRPGSMPKSIWAAKRAWPRRGECHREQNVCKNCPFALARTRTCVRRERVCPSTRFYGTPPMAVLSTSGINSV